MGSQVEEREVIKKTGCLPPCYYSEFTLVEQVEGFYFEYGMALAYATTEIKTMTEDWVYPGLSFIAEFGGALGLFLGFSFYMIWDMIVFFQEKLGGKKSGNKLGSSENVTSTNDLKL